MSDRRPSRTRRPLGDLSNLPLPPSPPADGQQLFASKLLSYSIDCARGIPLERWCTAGLLPTFGSSRTSCHRRFFNSSPAFLCCAVRLAHLFSTPPPKKSKGGSRPGSGRKPCPLRRLHTLTSHSVLRPSTRNGRLAYDSARRNELQLNQRLSELHSLPGASRGGLVPSAVCNDPASRRRPHALLPRHQDLGLPLRRTRHGPLLQSGDAACYCLPRQRRSPLHRPSSSWSYPVRL